jgi:hypothetical protein
MHIAAASRNPTDCFEARCLIFRAATGFDPQPPVASISFRGISSRSGRALCVHIARLDGRAPVETKLRRSPIDHSDEFAWDAVRLQVVV